MNYLKGQIDPEVIDRWAAQRTDRPESATAHVDRTGHNIAVLPEFDSAAPVRPVVCGLCGQVFA